MFKSTGTFGTAGGIEPEGIFIIICFLIFLAWSIFLTLRCFFLKLDIQDNKEKIEKLEKKIDDMKKE